MSISISPHVSRLLLAAVLMFFFSSTIFAAVGTLVLASGEHLENVEYSVNQQYKTVQLKMPEKNRNVSFTDIKAIYDTQGTDITVLVLKGVYKGQQTQWASEKDESYKVYHRKQFNVILRPGASFSIPIGDYYESIGPGIGFGGDVIIALNRMLALRGSLSMIGLSIENENGWLYVDPGFTIVSNDINIETYRYFLSMQYYTAFSATRPEKGHWFLYAGIGAVTNKLSISSVIRENASGNLYKGSGDDSQTKFTTTFGVGGVSMFSRQIGIEYSGSFDLLYVGTVNQDDTYYPYWSNVQTAGILDLRVGLVVLFSNDNHQK